MSMIDINSRMSNAQVLAAGTAESTNLIDLKALMTSLGVGKQMSVVVEVVAVGASVGTTDSFVFNLYTKATGSSIAGGTLIGTKTVLGAALAAGTKQVIPIPDQIAGLLEYIGMSYTLTNNNGTAACTVTSYLQPTDMIQNVYPTATGTVVAGH